MNNSTSTTSAAWPTRWPKDSFPAGATALVALGAVVLAAVILGIGLAWMAFTYRAQIVAGHPPIVPALVLQLILELAVVVLLIGMLPRLSGFSLRELGFRPPTLPQIGIALLGAVAMIVVVEGGASIIETLLHQKHEQQVVELFRQVTGNKPVAVFFAVFAIVLAPMMEEAIFRLFIFNIGLRYGGFWAGAIVSGLCFGLAHTDLFVLLPLALGGIVLCGVYYRTRNAFCSMITHGCFNALTVIAVFFAPQLAK